MSLGGNKVDENGKHFAQEIILPKKIQPENFRNNGGCVQGFK